MKDKGSVPGLVLLITSCILVLIGVVLYYTQPWNILSQMRDEKRKQDLSQIQGVLEAYYKDFAKYPDYDKNNYTLKLRGQEVSWGNPFMPYSKMLPRDPDSRYKYVYFSDPRGNNQTYLLYSVLENQSDPMACNKSGIDCPNVPSQNLCGGACNYGVSSSNTSP